MTVEKEGRWQGFLFSTDKQKLDIDYIHTWISSESYWAKGIPRSVVVESVKNSVAFGIYTGEMKQVGFARMITDMATFAYLADVFVDAQFRGHGLSKQLMEFIFSIPEFKGLRRTMLGTKDAHGLYKQFGFKALSAPERFMEIAQPDIYLRQ